MAGKKKKSPRFRDGDTGSWKSTRTLIWQNESHLYGALTMFAPSPLRSTERNQFPDLLPEDRLWALRLTQCFPQRRAEGQESENFLQADRSKERERRRG